MDRADKIAMRGCAIVFFALAGLMAYEQSHADDWTGPDKTQHAAISALIGSVAGAAVKDKASAFALAIAPGVVKELYDAQHPKTHTASWKDLAADAVGAAIGVYVGGCAVSAHSFICKLEF